MNSRSDQNRSSGILMVTSSFPFYSQTFVLKEMEAFLQTFDLRVLRIKEQPSTRIPWKSGEMFREKILESSKIQMLISNIGQFIYSPRLYIMTAGRVVRLHKGLSDRLKSLIVFFITIGHLPAIRRYAPSHIHSHFGNFPALAAYLVNRFSGIPFSFNCHGTDVLLDRQMLDEKSDKALFVTTVSEYNKRALRSQLKNPCRIHVFYLGTECPPHMLISRREKGTLLFVGRLSPEKNVASLLRALPLVDKNLLKKAVITGDGVLSSRLQRLCGQLGLDNLVEFTGKLSHEEVKEQYARADVFILPSYREGLPISLLEAMAHGAVSIASEITGIPEVITDGQNGYFIKDPNNIEEIAAKITTALQAPETVRMNGYESVKDKFNLQPNLQNKVAFFKKKLQMPQEAD